MRQIIVEVSPATFEYRNRLAKETNTPATRVLELLLHAADRESSHRGFPDWLGKPISRRPRSKPGHRADAQGMHCLFESEAGEVFDRLLRLTGGAQWWVAERLFTHAVVERGLESVDWLSNPAPATAQDTLPVSVPRGGRRVAAVP